MKQMNRKKNLLVVILAAVLLTFAVSGTIAYLMTRTDPVVNTFTPTEVNTEIEEKIENNAKTSITVKNPDDPNKETEIPAYVRVAVVGNWCDAKGKIVEPWTPVFGINTENWTQGSDNYYYYKKALEVGKTTENLLASGVVISGTDVSKPGLHLEVTVMQQAIQAEGVDESGNHPVEKMWGVTVNENGTLQITVMTP